MSKQELYKWVVLILRQLRVPFVDPCDVNYTGDCICDSGATGPTSEFFNARPIGTVGITLSSSPTVFYGLYEDGIRLRETIDFTRTGTNITFTVPTDAEHDYEVSYA